LQQFALLAIKRRQSTFSITAASFVLGQRHHTGHVGFGEPLDLLAERCPASPKVGPSRLQLLR
jgi:hypothetical protein